jgi:pimeloyl-ACP methyl ester carboxylesterase
MLDQRYLYFPAPLPEADWARVAQLPLEEVWLTTPDKERIHGWWVPAGEGAPVLFWLHGNAGNIADRLENLALIHRRGIAVYILDYRGYGRSSGTPSESGLYTDALTGMDYLKQQRGVPSRGIVVFGRSLGAAVAAEVVRQHGDVAGLVLETPFPSIAAVARPLYGGLPVECLLQARFELERRLTDITCPLLVIHGDRDQVVPYALGQRVFEAAREPKQFYTIPGADHNDTYVVGGGPYLDRLEAFIRAAVKP